MISPSLIIIIYNYIYQLEGKKKRLPQFLHFKVKQKFWERSDDILYLENEQSLFPSLVRQARKRKNIDELEMATRKLGARPARSSRS